MDPKLKALLAELSEQAETFALLAMVNVDEDSDADPEYGAGRRSAHAAMAELLDDLVDQYSA